MGLFKQKLLCLFFFIVVVCGGYGQNAQFVNPFIGTGKCNVSTLWGIMEVLIRELRHRGEWFS